MPGDSTGFVLASLKTLFFPSMTDFVGDPGLLSVIPEPNLVGYQNMCRVIVIVICCTQYKYKTS